MRSTENRGRAERVNISIPEHFPLEEKIKLWDSQHPRTASLAEQVNELICYSAELEHLMSRQPMALRAHIAEFGEDRQSQMIRDGIESWAKVQKFFRTDLEDIFKRFHKNQEYLTDGEFDDHKAWVLAMGDFERSIKSAFGEFATVLASLASQGYGHHQFESPGQRMRAAALLSEYNEAFAMNRRLFG